METQHRIASLDDHKEVRRKYSKHSTNSADECDGGKRNLSFENDNFVPEIDLGVNLEFDCDAGDGVFDDEDSDAETKRTEDPFPTLQDGINEQEIESSTVPTLPPICGKTLLSRAASRLQRKGCKIRSFSDTQNPLARYCLDPKTNQLVKRTDVCNKYNFNREPPNLPPIIGEESNDLDECIEPCISNGTDDASDMIDDSDRRETKERSKSDHVPAPPVTTTQRSRKISAPVKCGEPIVDPDRGKGKKLWLRKAAKYASFDEGTGKPRKTSKATFYVANDEDKREETAEKEDNTRQRKISTGKMIKQSVSQGFSKFKQLSLGGSGGSERNYSMINEDDALLHETSKRACAILPDDPIEQNQTDLDSLAAKVGKGKLMRRSSSLPSCLDSDSGGSCEDLSDLYLPRRMAICPDLPVEAMKQLRTYLVLTRLKQYCIV